MKTRQTWRGFAAGALLAAVLVLAVWPLVARGSSLAPGLPGGEAANVPNDLTPPLVIPAAAFSSDGIIPGGYRFYFSDGYLKGFPSACLKAAVYLPINTKITGMCASVYDNDASHTVFLGMYRVENYTGVVDAMADIGTTAADASTNILALCDYSIAFDTTTFPDYSYYLGVCLNSSDTRLYSVRLYYDLHVYLPAIVKLP